MPKLALGSRYGSFQIEAELGRGLTGSVYRASYTKDGTIVALKFLEQRDQSVRSYFLNEIGLLQRAKEHGRRHPHLVEYVTSFIAEEPFYLATRFYQDSQELTELLQHGVVPGAALRIIEQTASALDYLHLGHPDAPVIHRDVKPANLLVNSAGDVLLIDLSAACHAQFGLEQERGLGTPQYMPPEQYLGEEQPQTDQFALAMVAYQLLTGKPLLSSRPDRDSKQMRALHDSDYARIRSGMRAMAATATVIARAVAFDWQLRYPTCEEFAHNLRRALVADGVALEVAATPPPAPRRISWQWAGYAAMAIAAIVALFILFANPLSTGMTLASPTAVQPTDTLAALSPSKLVLNVPESEGVTVIPTSPLLPIAAQAAPSSERSITSADCLVRNEPSTDSAVLVYTTQSRTVPPGTVLPVLVQQGNWYKVQLADGRSGWCPDHQVAAADAAPTTPAANIPAPARATAVAPRPAAPPAPPRPAAPPPTQPPPPPAPAQPAAGNLESVTGSPSDGGGGGVSSDGDGGGGSGDGSRERP